jgi:hypothetical protein
LTLQNLEKRIGMIGVLADPSEQAAVSEFFELFKTPWEVCKNDRDYEVVLSAGRADFNNHNARFVLFYAGREQTFDAEQRIEIAARRDGCVLSYKGFSIPIYGDCVTFGNSGEGLLVEKDSRQAAMRQHKMGGEAVVRIGYDLFGEVSKLLTAGQPVAYAAIPTLELHIALLRDLIVENGIALVEVPPAPEGYKFIACLTHDVDHPSIARHKWDHTAFGFLHRAAFGSVWNLLRGRISIKNQLSNWVAVVKLPFVYLGLAKDFWSGFEDRYLEVEKGLCSTYFVIPFKNDPGKCAGGLIPRFRAAGYGAKDIEDTIAKIVASGCEVGLHGIDAWCDSSRGSEEFEEIRRLAGVSEVGVRMHWLYCDERSPLALEQAGAAYDSTVGYRETVGYRAGTTQAYKPWHAVRLLEVPMHIMDTALFYPAYLGLSAREAVPLLRRMVDNVVEFGGCMTINWHDRSLAPERLWNGPYRDLVQDLKNRGAWFATAGQAAAWFRKRRSLLLEGNTIESEGWHSMTFMYQNNGLPGLKIRTHRKRRSHDCGLQSADGYVDVALKNGNKSPDSALSSNE